MESSELNHLLEKFRSLKILILGDIMVDQYVWGQVDRISPEAPVPVVQVTREEKSLGGMGNVLRNIVPYGAKILPIMILGKEGNDLWVHEELSRLGIQRPFIIEDTERSVPLKIRILSSAQQLVRIDHETPENIHEALEDKVLGKVHEVISSCDIVLLSDYAKGLLTPRVIKETIQAAKKSGRPVLVDPKRQNYEIYRGCTLITPNRKEAEAASGILFQSEEDMSRSAQTIQKMTDAEAVLITRGKDGMELLEGKGPLTHISTQAKEVFDVTGAGDTVLAFMGMGIGAGLDYRSAAELANRAAGVVVGKIGAAEVFPDELLSTFFKATTTSNKIYSPESLLEKINVEKRGRKKIVFTNGCFDLLHPGHVTILEGAKAKGDILVVALNSDLSVEKLKGTGRPILPLKDRARLMAALSCVDYVTSFDEATPEQLIKKLQPDVLIKGGDYQGKEIVGKETVEANGGYVDTIPFEENHSTSALIRKIQFMKGSS